ncbi:unnamed protein product [Bemisia tabaci]|nr:unnamed protein product [Bemisia tabaci]
MISAIKEAIHFNPHFSGDENTACVYLVLIGERSQTNSSLQLNQLPFWAGDGRNHILINLSRQDLSSDFAGIENLNFSRAIVAQSSWLHSLFRPGHDLVIPPALGPPGGDVWFDCPYMLPARRKYLISFEAYSTVSSSYSFDYSVIAKYLTSKTSDKFFFAFGCEPGATQFKEEYNLCGNETTRSVILKDSTFALITPPVNSSFVSTPLFQARLYEAMKYGAIPVVLGNDHVQLPYSEVIYWRKAVIGLPVSRITELHFLLRSISDADILLMRRQTRLLWERYFSSVQAIIDSVLAVVRDRINLPPSPIREEPSPSVFSDNFVPLKIEPVVSDAKPEENLGPLEPPYASPKFKRNFTIMLTQGYELWNEWGDPFRLYPQIPFDPLLPSDAKFIGSGVGFRPVNQGAGGAGKEFCESLGGNSPREQFTIVILTYEREQVLMNSLSRLHGLPYLHQVVVVWNSPRPPLEDLRWPEIGVPVKVIKAPYNSLNNRFLPYEAIETEAVLSVDDDAHLRHDEIIFGFRVWREHRDRVVGFPGRFHALDINYKPGWLYNSNYSCELSMVLTGAAFVHKYYLYLYSNWLPQAIRDKVDEYMNCEDIAMNFLVSHVTRKPPIKVTSRWTFRCPGCPVSLSEDDTHFQERHKCINFFTKIFGYTPLLNTQFRADSILFKTRIPHDKQKCFKFI